MARTGGQKKLFDLGTSLPNGFVYRPDFLSERIAILGRGRLVGWPLLTHLMSIGANKLEIFDEDSDDLEIIEGINEASVIISAMGRPGLLTPDLFEDMSKSRALVDAGAAEQGGVVMGDVSDELRDQALQNGWQITPRKGGVGPLTVRTLLTNVIRAAEDQVKLVEV